MQRISTRQIFLPFLLALSISLGEGYGAWFGVSHLLSLGKLSAQSVTMPKEVKGEARRLLSIQLEYDGDDVRWTVSGDVDLIREYDPDAKKIRLRAIAYAEGKYEIKAVACKDKKLCDFVTCTLIIGKGPDPIPPVPPIPPDPPVPPPGPSPTKGKRCIILYETGEETKLPEKQQQILRGATVRGYLREKCVKEPDGKTPSCGFFDKDSSLDGYSKELATMKQLGTGKTLPWVMIGNDTAFYEGPLPADVDAFMILAKKYLETK